MRRDDSPLHETGIDIEEIKEGLRQPQKSLPSKYFYDRRGSELFEKICTLDEYYPTETELQIIEENIDEIASQLGEDFSLIELGSGSSYKTRLLLDHLKALKSYYPVDISEAFLLQTVRELKESYPDLKIQPVVADYTQYFPQPNETPSGSAENRSALPGGRRVVFFPGSTIGNFSSEEVTRFLQLIHQIVAPDGGFLVGVDLKKSRETLEAAYNDSEGVTAAFNKNLLERLNREAGANFDPERFEHRALYNEKEGRIEMHLVSLEPQQAEVGGETFRFEEGETIHTENSYKYTLEEFAGRVSDLFRVERVWTDEADYFSLQYLIPV